MRVRVWGARGSIPVSGPQYVRYGGDTTCVEVETAAGATVVLDAGTGLRALGNKLLAEGRREFHLLLSHAHWDHVLGLPFFKPLYRKKCTVHVHGCTWAQESVRSVLHAAMQPPFFPVPLDKVDATLDFVTTCGDDFEVAGLRVRSFPLSHPNNGFGFLLEEAGRTLAFFPDNEPAFAHPDGRTAADYARFVAGCDLLVHDGEYLPAEYEAYSRGWGHSVYLDTVKLGQQARVGSLLLWHLNQDRDDDGCDALLGLAREAATGGSAPLPVDLARTGWEREV